MYTPDTWVIIKIENPEYEKVYYKVLAGWSGGYFDGDAWRLNSGITKIELIDNFYHFSGHSGSIYKCHKDGETMRASQSGTWNRMKENFGDHVEIVKVDDIIGKDLGL